MRTIKLTLLLAFVSMCALAQPTIKTNTRYARGATKAFGRMSLLMNGESIQESGFCWSQNSKEPTINDNKSTKKWSNNGQIVVMEGLEPATLYYARAYVTTGKGETYYGNTIKFCTVPKGSISWGYDNGGSSAENARINSAVQSCVDYWNEYTSITGLYLNVHYGSGTPTADCSYGGWMRVGPNSAYQSTGTIMHEALHAIGVGTTEMWFGASSPLRQGAGTGDWLGYNANEFVKFWDNNSSACLKGDGTHLWPYGINGAQEDNHTEALYAACSMVAQAVCEDGIACNGGYAFGMPHYSFTQEDDIKYYIKNEDETRGLSTSFLVETAANKLQWQTMTADEAAANDAAAWYVTFIPSKQVYQLRNAATGNYMTYKQSGTDGIVCEASSSQTTNNTFCLMRSRTDVTSSTGTKLTTERGYWLLNPELSNAKPYCLEASSNGSVSAMQYSNLDASKRQRWLILNADQAKAMENSGLVAARDAFDQVNVVANELPFTPHACITPDADDVYEASLAKIQANLEATTSPTEVNNLTTELRTAMMNYLANIYVTDLNNPFDLTGYLVNPNFDTNTNGWTMINAGTYGYNEIEFYVDKVKNVSLLQLVKNMPAGSYGLKVQGFQRPGSYNQVYSDYIAGTNNVKVTMEMTMEQRSFASQKVKNIMDDRQPSEVVSGDVTLGDGTHIPNSMASARAYFDKGYFDNCITGYTPYTGGLRIYFKGDNSAASSWTICDNFRLYYYGGLPLEDIEENINAIEFNKSHSKPLTTKMFNVLGQQVSGTAKGLVIINGKKYLKR